MTAAQLGLNPTGALGDAWLIPFQNKRKGVTEAKLIPGYRGLARLTIQSGHVESIYADCIYDGELCEVHGGTDPRIEHRPDPACREDEAAFVGAYAVAFPRGGGRPWFAYLSRKELDKIRNSSRGRDSDAYKIWPGPMAKKAAVLRVVKLVPMSPTDKIAQALKIEEAVETGRDLDPTVVEALAIPDLPEDTNGKAGAEAQAPQDGANDPKQGNSSADVPPPALGAVRQKPPSQKRDAQGKPIVAVLDPPCECKYDKGFVYEDDSVACARCGKVQTPQGSTEVGDLDAFKREAGED